MADLVVDASSLRAIASRVAGASGAVAWTLHPLDFETLGDGEVTHAVGSVTVAQKARCEAISDETEIVAAHPTHVASSLDSVDDDLARGLG